MHIELSALSLQLPRGATMRLEAVRGLIVLGRSGRLWLTEQGCGEDVFLHAGDCYKVVASGRVVIGAEQDASLALQAPDPVRHERGRSSWRIAQPCRPILPAGVGLVA